MSEPVPSSSPRRRRLLRATLWLGLGIVLAAGTSPFWFPRAALALARGQGLRVQAVDRWNGRTFTLVGLAADRPGLRLTAGRVEVVQPLAWLTRLAAGGRSPAMSIQVLDWQVEVRSEPGAEPEPDSAGLTRSLDALEAAWSAVPEWAGEARLERGKVAVDGREFEVPVVRIGSGGGSGTLAWQGRPLDVALRHPSPGRFELSGSVAPWSTQFEMAAGRAGNGWEISGEVVRRGDRVKGSARFAPAGWLPEEAGIEGSGITIPLPDGVPGDVRAGVRGTWRAGVGEFAASATGRAGWPGGGNATEPVEVSLSGRATTNRLEVAVLNVVSEILELRLRQPATLALVSPLRVPAAEIDFAARLEAFSRGAVSGRIRGTWLSTAFDPGTPGGSRVRVEGRGEGIESAGIRSVSAEAKGRLEWPAAILDSLEVDLAQGATASASGEFDLPSRVISRARWSFAGLLPERLVGTNHAEASIRAEGTLQGPLTNLVQELELLTLRPVEVPSLRPVSLRATGRIRGRTIELATVTVTNGAASLELEAAAEALPADAAPRDFRIELRTVRLREGGTPVMENAVPMTVRLRAPEPGGPAKANEWTAEWGATRWEGSAGSVRFSASTSWPRRGRLEVGLERLSPASIAPWLVDPDALPAGYRLHRCEGAVEWDDGPVEARVSFDVEGPLPRLGVVRWTGDLRSGREGIHLREMTATRAGEPGPRMSGVLPMTWTPTPAGGQWRALPGAEVAMRIEAGPETWPWKWLAEEVGVEPVEPRVSLELGGPWRAPKARMDLRTGPLRARLPAWGTNVPPVDGVELRASASAGEIEVERFRVQVEGQEIHGEGRLPWRGNGNRPPEGEPGPDTDPMDSLLALVQAEWAPDWARASGRLEVPGANLTALTVPWRQVLQPGGRLRASLGWESGGLAGWVEVGEVNTAAIPPVGALREIDLRLAVTGRRVSIERGGLILGGHPVALSGWFALPAGGEPTAELRATGTNLALVRLPEVLLRADVDLSITRTNPAAPPVLGGALLLHDSVVLMDFRKLVSVDLDRPQRRPPFFAVEQAPFSEWGLDVRLRGEQFARVLSPVFRGTVSADLRLLGTLGQPRLAGQGLVERGRLLFPFGQLELEQARVVFGEANPFRPELEGRAEGLSFGYSINLEIRGTLSEPALVFTSVPPLSTGQVLQMLMAGTVPNNGYSYSAGSKAQRFGTYLAGDLFSQLAGDPMAESKLMITSGERVASDGQLTHGVEYRLSDRWSVVGEYDQWNQLGAGLRWRVLEK